MVNLFNINEKVPISSDACSLREKQNSVLTIWNLGFIIKSNVVF